MLNTQAHGRRTNKHMRFPLSSIVMVAGGGMVSSRWQPPGALARTDEAGKGLHHQAGAHDDQQVGRGHVGGALAVEAGGQGLAEEHNVGLDQAAARECRARME